MLALFAVAHQVTGVFFQPLPPPPPTHTTTTTTVFLLSLENGPSGIWRRNQVCIIWAELAEKRNEAKERNDGKNVEVCLVSPLSFFFLSLFFFLYHWKIGPVVYDAETRCALYEQSWLKKRNKAQENGGRNEIVINLAHNWHITNVHICTGSNITDDR